MLAIEQSLYYVKTTEFKQQYFIITEMVMDK